MRHLHPRQKMILEYLLKNPTGATAEDLCQVADVTKTAIKSHLSQLESYGYVLFRDQKNTVGRPRRFYMISKEGGEVFPRRYSWLSTALLEQLSQTLSSDQVAKVLKGIAEKTAAPLLVKMERMTRKERLETIVGTMMDLGYHAHLKSVNSKGAVIEASNCVFHTTAIEQPQICQFDIHFLEKTSGLHVELEECLARGGSSCRFCLRNKTS